jgi:hypothetical protein
MKNKQETFYRLTIKDNITNTNESQPLAYHTQSAALDSAYHLLEERGGVSDVENVDSSYILWSEDNSLRVEINPILI